jgi:hypothetical protein
MTNFAFRTSVSLSPERPTPLTAAPPRRETLAI